ncbi:MAG: hypothetical protein QOD67_3612 [Caballeronia sp.]|jgi:hypothetical protein|nr:hypothetical protein [Caballeronia sp.]
MHLSRFFIVCAQDVFERGRYRRFKNPWLQRSRRRNGLNALTSLSEQTEAPDPIAFRVCASLGNWSPVACSSFLRCATPVQPIPFSCT